MDYTRYDRFFVMLEEQSEDFAMRQSARCGGHIKIETGNDKGALRIGVRNLKYFDKNDYIYKLIFFGTAREKTIYAIIGTVNVNKIGNGETYFRFDPKSMDKSGHELADFSYAIVAAVSMKDENEPLHPVMKGVLELPFYEEEIKAARESGAGDEGGAGKGAADVVRETAEPVRACYNSYYNRYIAAQCYKINQNVNIYDRIVPFKEDATDAEWTKMTLATPLPIVSPSAWRLAEKYKHYIFGKGKRFYYFGVPGRFLREEQPEEGESGFLLWQPILGAEGLRATDEDATDETRRQAYGYWIIAIDIEKGDILEA